MGKMEANTPDYLPEYECNKTCSKERHCNICKIISRFNRQIVNTISETQFQDFK